MTLNPVFNEKFFIDLPGLTKQELEEGSIVFSVFDYHNIIQAPSLIGSFEIDLTSIYFSPGHELYRTTLMLIDPEEEEFSTTTGLLKVDIELLGPEDEPNVHDIDYQKVRISLRKKYIIKIFVALSHIFRIPRSYHK